LSVEGERYFSVCRQSLDEIDRVEVERAATRTDPGGSVRIRVPPLFGILVIAPALFALADAHSVLPFDMTLKGETVNFLAQRGSGRQDWQSSRCVRIDRTPARPPDDHTLRILQLSRPASNAAVDIRSCGASAGRNQWRERRCSWPIAGLDGEVETWAPPARLLLDSSALTLSAIKADRGIGLLP
jgi:DNA-binding transcriptional LysR family regulator